MHHLARSTGRRTSSASSSSVSDLQDGGAAVEVSARRSATLSVCRRRLRTATASLALQFPGHPGALDSDVYWPAQPLLCFARGPETEYQRPFDHQNCRSLYSSASTRLTCSSTRQCWLKLWVTCTILWRCCDYTARSAPTTNV